MIHGREIDSAVVFDRSRWPVVAFGGSSLLESVECLDSHSAEEHEEPPSGLELWVSPPHMETQWRLHGCRACGDRCSGSVPSELRRYVYGAAPRCPAFPALRGESVATFAEPKCGECGHHGVAKHHVDPCGM